MQHKFKGPFFFQVCIHIYSSGAVHNAAAEVVSACSLEPLTFEANFKPPSFFRAKKVATETRFELKPGVRREFLGWDRAALLFDGCAVFMCGRACTKRLWGGFAACSRTARALWKWSCSVPRVLFKV